MSESGDLRLTHLFSMIPIFELLGRDVAERPEEPRVVEPMDPRESGALDVVDAAPRAEATDHLGLVEAVDALREGVVVGVADAADGALDARFAEALGVPERHVLNAAIAVVDEARDVTTRVKGLLECVEREVGGRELDTRQPTMAREKTSMTKATYAKPAHVATYVMSATQSWLGRDARKARLTRSGARAASSQDSVVTVNARPRVTPRSPAARIKRSTVHRAATMPSRPSWRHTFSAPYTPPWLAKCTRLISGSSTSSRLARSARSAGSRRRAACS